MQAGTPQEEEQVRPVPGVQRAAPEASAPGDSGPGQVGGRGLSAAQRLMIEDGFPADLIVPQAQRDAEWKGRKLRKTIDFADPKSAKPTDPGTVALLAKKKQEAKETEKAKRAARKEARIIAARRRAQPEEAGMAKTKQASAAAPKAAKKGAHSASRKSKATKGALTDTATSNARKAVRPGSKLEIVVDLLTRKGGCTTADILKATGWPSVSVPQQAKAAGLTLHKEKRDGVTVYSAA